MATEDELYNFARTGRLPGMNPAHALSDAHDYFRSMGTGRSQTASRAGGGWGGLPRPLGGAVRRDVPKERQSSRQQESGIAERGALTDNEKTADASAENTDEKEVPQATQQEWAQREAANAAAIPGQGQDPYTMQIVRGIGPQAVTTQAQFGGPQGLTGQEQVTNSPLMQRAQLAQQLKPPPKPPTPPIGFRDFHEMTNPEGTATTPADLAKSYQGYQSFLQQVMPQQQAAPPANPEREAEERFVGTIGRGGAQQQQPQIPRAPKPNTPITKEALQAIDAIPGLSVEQKTQMAQQAGWAPPGE